MIKPGISQLPLLLLLGLLSGCSVTQPIVLPQEPAEFVESHDQEDVIENVGEFNTNRQDDRVWTLLPEQLSETESPALLEPEPAELPSTPAPGDRILEIALQALGSPYRRGGTTPTGFDCSGLVYFAHLKAGIKVPRSSLSQHQAAEAVPFDELLPGDLLFFNVKPQRISHVGIFVEKNVFLHATSSGKDVRFSRLDEPYWKKRLVSAGRFAWPTGE